MPGRPPQPQVAQCEDYDSDEGRTIPDSRTCANVAAKRRLQSSGMARPAGTAKLGPASDSGYSSHTTGTMGSADSAKGAVEQAAPLKVKTPATTTKTRPALVDARRDSKRGSSRPPSRRTSRTRQPGHEAYKDCKDPGCRECSGSSRPRPSPLESPLDINYPPFAHSTYHRPPSPQGFNYPPGYAQFVPNVRPPEPRRRLPSTSGPRPMTYHAGMAQEGYWAPVYGMTPDPTAGPPPSMSAYANLSMPGAWPVLGATPPGAEFPPPVAQIPQSPISPSNQMRQTPTQQSSAVYSARPRPGSMYGAPSSPLDPQPLAPRLTQPIVHQQQLGPRDHDPTSLFKSQRDCDCDSCTMPPPQVVPARRPGIQRHHTTYPDTFRSSRRSGPADLCRCPECDPEATIRAPTHRRRPSLAESAIIAPGVHRKKSVSYSHPSGSKTITIESPRDKERATRRLSYAGHERKRQLERERDAEAYQDVSSGGKTSAQLTAEALMKATQGISGDIPYARPRSVTQSSRISGGGSRVSKASGTKSSGETSGEGFKIRIGGTDLEFSGDMEVRLRSNKDGSGNTEVVIGSARREVRYPDEGKGGRRSDSVRASEDGRRGRRRESKSRSAVGRVNGELP